MSIKSAPRLLSLLVALSSALVAAVPVRADQLPDHHGRVTVENVWITPANEAGQAILRLRILNETRSPMHLLGVATPLRSEEHTSELQSLMRISYAVFCLKKKTHQQHKHRQNKARSALSETLIEH